MLNKNNLKSIAYRVRTLARDIANIEIGPAHTHELIAAYYGFKSNSAFNVYIEDLEFIPDPSETNFPLQKRLACLNGLSINESQSLVLEAIIPFVFNPTTNTVFNLLSQMHPGRLSTVQRPLSEVLNTYFFVFVDSQNQNFSISFPNGSHIFFFPKERAGLTAGWVEVIDQQQDSDKFWFRRLESDLHSLLTDYELVDRPFSY